MGKVKVNVTEHDELPPACPRCGRRRRVMVKIGRPAFALADRSPHERARIDLWERSTPLTVLVCESCLPARLLLARDRAVLRLAKRLAYFGLFGHPLLVGKKDWRPARRVRIEGPHR